MLFFKISTPRWKACKAEKKFENLDQGIVSSKSSQIAELRLTRSYTTIVRDLRRLPSVAVSSVLYHKCISPSVFSISCSLSSESYYYSIFLGIRTNYNGLL